MMISLSEKQKKKNKGLWNVWLLWFLFGELLTVTRIYLILNINNHLLINELDEYFDKFCVMINYCIVLMIQLSFCEA